MKKLNLKNKIISKIKSKINKEKTIKFLHIKFNQYRSAIFIIVGLIFATGIFYQAGLFTTLARVGFNLNVVNTIDGPKDPFYKKLTNYEDKKDTNTYNVWDGTTSNSFSGGTGSKNDPYLISSVSELRAIETIIQGEKKVYYDNYEETCDYDDVYAPTLRNGTYVDSGDTSNGRIYRYRTTETITFKNNSATETISDVTISVTQASNATYYIYSATSNGGNFNISTNPPLATGNSSNTIKRNETITIGLTNGSLAPGATVTITLVLSSTSRTNPNLSYDSIQVYDKNGNEHIAAGSCKIVSASAGLYFKVTNNLDFNNINFESMGDDTKRFMGNLDIDYHTFKNMKFEDGTDNDEHYMGIFGITEDAVIKNVFIDNSNLTVNGPGKISASFLVAYAKGYTRVYNVGINSAEIKINRNSTNAGYVGGMVGRLSEQSVAANSYTYGNVTSNGTSNSSLYLAGLVGNRDTTSSSMELGTDPIVYMLVNYGDFSVKNNKYQYVYNGTIAKASINPSYCYYLWVGSTIDMNDSSNFDDNYSILKAQEDMTAAGFYSHLNTYRFMVNYYVGNDDSPNQTNEDGYNDIGIWSISNDESIYPKMKQYTNTSSRYTKYYAYSESEAISKFGAGNYLKVNIQQNGEYGYQQTQIMYLAITDKNEKENDYTNHKITMPFNSVSTKYQYNYSGTNSSGFEMNISGWDLVSVKQNGTTYSSSINGSTINYNYVLRTGSDGARKDIGTTYAQGGFYLVPDGVTEITIKAHWAKTVYAKDMYNDMVYYHNSTTNYISNTTLSNEYGTTGASSSTNGKGKTPETAVNSIANAKAVLSTTATSTYDQIIMLCGNLHMTAQSTSTSTAHSWNMFTGNSTIMSMDNDGDLIPDYALYTRGIHDESSVTTFRLDFVNYLSQPQVGNINSKLNIYTPRGEAEIEVTETATTDRIDMRHASMASLRLNGGFWNIYNIWGTGSYNTNKNYFIFGGTAKAIYVNSGLESRQATKAENTIPVMVINGGRIEYLSTTYLGTSTTISNDAYIYVDGGYIDSFYATYNSPLKKSATIEVNGSYINHYYAGGHTESAIINEGVTTTINNSRVGELYGGPHYGSVVGTSLLNIDNTEIDSFFGSGYGGTQTTETNLGYNDSSGCSSRVYSYTITDNCSGSQQGDYCFGKYNSTYGIQTAFYAIMYSKQACIAKAYATYFSTLSSASVDNVVVNISNSVVNGDFYGGGNKGKVDESVIINMDNTEIKGNIYGGGRSDENETVDVYENTDGYKPPEFISYTIDAEATYPKKVQYTWSSDKTKFGTNTYINKTQKLIYSANEGHLGNVDGFIILNINNSNIEGNIYGGGNASSVNADIYLNIDENTIVNEIYGGGNRAEVNGLTEVRLNGTKVSRVYGGGNAGDVNGDTYVTLLNGSTVENVFGGGNSASVTKSNVYIENGTVTNAYGGSNAAGTVEDSNVYIGVVNTHDYYTKNQSEMVTSDVTTGTNTPNAGWCGGTRVLTATGLFTVENNDLANISYTLTNNTGVTLKSFNLSSQTSNITNITNATGHVYSYYNNAITGSGNISLGNDKSIDLTNNLLKGIITYGWGIVNTPTVTAVGVNGKTYSTEDCYTFKTTSVTKAELVGGTETEEQYNNHVLNAKVTNTYGANNAGGTTIDSHVTIGESTVNEVFGGGNLAEVDNSTTVSVLDGANVAENLFGGGNRGRVNGTSVVNIIGGELHKSVYAGGNGAEAVVTGDTNLNMIGNAHIYGNLFGGGNAAETGTNTTNNSSSVIDYAGGTVDGNVYGGANTSKVWGTVHLNIGASAYRETTEKLSIKIGGTVFGGGEANASGSDSYDFTYISVTVGINVNIDGTDYDNIDIGGSIFGSGNASSTSGYSYINLNNFGTRAEPKHIAAIQRAGRMTLTNSSIDVSGLTDSTNEYSTIVYSLSRIDHLILANDSTLYLQSATNVLKEVSSKLINEDTEEISYVTIDPNTHESTKNVDNRIYLVINKAVNVIDAESLSNGTYGRINGMMFLGLYEESRDGTPDTGIYRENYKNGSVVDEEDTYKLLAGSYMAGLHKISHDITIDGFYTNYLQEDKTIKVDYIKPTPEDAVYYQWIVGEASKIYNITLTASKFATMGTGALELQGFETPNTYFEVVNYNDNNIEPGIQIIDSDDVPRVADTEEDALKTFGLKMTSSTNGWLTDGMTNFISTDSLSQYNGTDHYVTENSNLTPTLYFYLIHSKNISEDIKLGSITIALLAYVPIDAVTYQITRIFIEVTMDTKYWDTNNYESSMTPGKKYELFLNSKVSITSDSALSAYFALYMKSDKTIYGANYYRVMLSNYNLPVNTRITMVDRTDQANPVYYYYVVTQASYDSMTTEITSNAEGLETTFYVYKFSDFIRMDSTSIGNKYSDAITNQQAYNDTTKTADEEFIFIVDYSETSMTYDLTNAEILMELKDEDDMTRFDTLGVSHADMVYNVYSNAKSKIDINLTKDRETAYAGYEFNMAVLSNLVQPTTNGGLVAITDTNYTQDKMGLKITLYNSSGEKVNGTTLMGTLFYVNGVAYSARLDGSIRLKVADRVANTASNIRVDLSKSILPTDTYTISIESFGSPDGLYYGLTSAGIKTTTINIINENYGILSTTEDKNIILNSDTGLNTEGENELSYNIDYYSQFNNANIRIKLYRRNYDEIYDMSYREVDLADYITDVLTPTSNAREYLVTNTPASTNTFTVHTKENLMTGTYKMVFEIYNDDNYITEVYSYLIIK